VVLVATTQGHSRDANSSSPPLAQTDTTDTTPASAPSASASATPYGGEFVQEYEDISFSMPGGAAISGVSFTEKGPEVSTDAGEMDKADLQYFANPDPTLGIRYAGVEMAPSSGTPDARTCDETVKRNPISKVNYPSLKVGAVFCLTNTMNDQLVRLRLTGKRRDRLTWVATGWLSQSE
jgi:hypothetical protein